jgi:Phosphotransferase system, mannose/fructose/N-acetylgalactosamine-specific component IIB
LQSLQKQHEKILVIFSDCSDVRTAYDAGVRFSVLNIGNMHYAPGKQQICGHAAFSPEDATYLRTFAGLGIGLDFRCVPNDKTEVKDW